MDGSLKKKESGPLFVEASQLLTSLERREEALQGCFLYENSVLCSHLDVDMTRWILCRTEHLRGVLPPRSVHQSAVFVLTEQAERMQRVKSQYTEGHVHPSPLADTQPVKITSLPSAGGDYLGLLVVLMEKLTIGLVITFDTLVNEAYGSNLMKAERSRFDLLEHRLSVVLAEEPPMPHAPSGSAWLEVPITQGGGGIRNHAELGYRILRLDSFTRRGVGNGTEDRHDEAEQTFLRSVRYAREMFANDSDVSQVVLRDYPGTLYARRVLGQETYFRPLLKAVGKHGKFVAVNTELEGIERRAANSLLHHHELHLL